MGRSHHGAWVVQVLGVGVHGENACAEAKVLLTVKVQTVTSSLRLLNLQHLQ